MLTLRPSRRAQELCDDALEFLGLLDPGEVSTLGDEAELRSCDRAMDLPRAKLRRWVPDIRGLSLTKSPIVCAA